MKFARWMLFVLVASATIPLSAAAKYTLFDFGLKQKWSQCDGPGTYNLDLVWAPVAGALEFVVASGNQCRLNGRVCGTRAGCGTHVCPAKGVCEMHLTGCQQGRGGAFVRIADPAGRYQNLTTAAPRRCN
jgi:hypothetical protein